MNGFLTTSPGDGQQNKFHTVPVKSFGTPAFDASVCILVMLFTL